MDKSQKSSEIPLDLALIMVTVVSSDLFSGSMKSNSIFVMSSPALSPVFIACASVHAIYKSWGRPGNEAGGGLGGGGGCVIMCFMESQYLLEDTQIVA